MKIMALLLFIALLSFSCTEKKNKKTEEMLPVEADGGIGDGAEPLDSLLEKQTDTLQR